MQKVSAFSPYKQKFKPIVLKQLVLDCGLVQAELARLVGCSRTTVNLAINRGWVPPDFPDFRPIVEKLIAGNTAAGVWLKEHGHKLRDIWQPLGKRLRNKLPSDIGQRVTAGKTFKAMVPGDPARILTIREVEMLSHKASKLFKLFRSPFVNDIDPEKDVYLSEDHRYIEAAMLDAAHYGGFIAVIGEVGSGKTTIRRLVNQKLKKDENMRIIFPRIVDKSRITAASICDAIILDLDPSAKPKVRLEQKSRQVEQLLLTRSKAGCRMVLILEEAHDLKDCPRALKLLKRFHEIEDANKKILGIILIGQPELGELFNEADHYDMREVIRRCQVAYIMGLNGSLREYLQFKFKRVGITDIRTIITDNAIDALGKRLVAMDNGREIHTSYPLTVNNYLVRAMNYAAEYGFEKVTDEVVNAI